MKILVLGRNGQVGWEAQRALSVLGPVTALGRPEIDVEDTPRLRDTIRTAAPDVIVNAIAYTAVDKAENEPQRANRVNHRAVAEIGAIAAGLGAWVIHYSTDYVFDGEKDGAYSETDATAPLGAYGRSKLAGDVALAASGARHLIFRTSWAHAPRGNNFIRTMLRLAAERDSLRVVADRHGAPTSAELIADVTAHAIADIGRGEAPAPGVYNLTASGSTSWHGLAQFALTEAAQAGLALRVKPDAIEPIATADYPTPARRPRNSVLDTGKLSAALGIALPDWRVHVRRTVQQLVEQSAR